MGSSSFAAQQAVTAWGGGQTAAGTGSREDSPGAIPVAALQSGREEEQAGVSSEGGTLAWKGGVSAGTGDRKENKKDTPKWVLLAPT